MEITNQIHAERKQSPVSLKKPLFIFALPFIVLFPSLWFLHDFIPQHAASGRMTVEHMQVHWGAFWVVTFFPFTAICFLSSAVMLIRRARYSSGARWALVLVSLLALGVTAFVVFIVSDIVSNR